MNDQLNGWFHCLGLLMVQSTFITLVVVDLLLLSHSLIFTVTNLSGGPSKYVETNAVIATALPYSILTPLLFMQTIWLVSCLMGVFALKSVLPYFQLPYLLSSSLSLASLAWLIVRIVDVLLRDATLQWPMALLLCSANLVFIEQLYFSYIKCVCFKMLVRKRRMVSTTERHHSSSSTLGGIVSKLNMAGTTDADTYSTKSTVIIEDECLNKR